MKRLLLCKVLRRHDPILVFDKVSLRSVGIIASDTLTGAPEFTVTESHRECRRCHLRLG